uniref:pathogen-associated molecular patterns-induced protein A70-like n=1 Tax=Erigeron canadensis TaxID=72917 RepID=UPI001CB8F510|nr:pathogen-associated molecular patterns-induced protein A70-like [Erigeron canadensis]
MEESSPLSILASMNSWFTPTILFIFLNLMIATILFTSNLPNNNNNNTQQNQKVAQNENNQNDLNQSKLTRSPSILHRLRSFNFHPHKSQQYQQPPQQELQQLQEPLEVAATEYVFNHPLFPHDQDPQPISQNSKKFDLDPTRVNSDTTHVDLDPTRFEKQPTLVTHFYEEKNHTIERVITHFNFGPTDIEKSDPDHVETDPTRIENEDPVDLVDSHEEEKDELKSLDEIYSNITGGHVNRTKSDTLPASGEIPVKLPAKMKKSASMKSAFSHFEEEKIVEARRPETVRERRSAARTAAEGDVEVDARADDFINKFKHQLKLQRLDSIIRYKEMVNRGSEK